MTKNLRFFAMIAVLLVAIAACSKEEGAEVIVPQPEQENSFRVSVGDALRSAEAILNSGDRATRSVERKVKSTEIYVAKPATRSNDDVEVSFYLINYEDNAGFALVSTDKRATPVYMYADEGNITTEAFEEVPPMAIFMEEAVANYEAEVASSGTDGPIDIILPPGMDGHMTTIDGIECYLNIDTTYVDKGPFTRTRWHQNSPYGDACPNLVAGCVPVAIGQIMAYHKHPASFGNDMFDWDLMTQVPHFSSSSIPGATDVMNLLHKIGLFANADYNFPSQENDYEASTGVDAEMVPIIFLFWGYTCSDLENYSADDIIIDLNYSRPVVVGGSRYNDNGKLVGHSWIIHGYHCVKRNLRYYYTTPPYDLYKVNTTPTYYFRHNIGWGSGYYDLYLLDTECLHPIDKDMITGIQPYID